VGCSRTLCAAHGQGAPHGSNLVVIPPIVLQHHAIFTPLLSAQGQCNLCDPLFRSSCSALSSMGSPRSAMAPLQTSLPAAATPPTSAAWLKILDCPLSDDGSRLACSPPRRPPLPAASHPRPHSTHPQLQRGRHLARCHGRPPHHDQGGQREGIQLAAAAAGAVHARVGAEGWERHPPACPHGHLRAVVVVVVEGGGVKRGGRGRGASPARLPPWTPACRGGGGGGGRECDAWARAPALERWSACAPPPPWTPACGSGGYGVRVWQWPWSSCLGALECLHTPLRRGLMDTCVRW